MAIEVEFNFWVTWKDDRLIFDKHVETYLEKKGLYKLPEAVKKRLWIPDISFPGCTRCNNTSIADQKFRPMWLLSRDNRLWLEFRSTMTFLCQYDLKFYPFDVHTCNVLVGLEDVDERLVLKNASLEDVSEEPVSMTSEFYFLSRFVKAGCELKGRNLTDNNMKCLQYGIQFHRISAYYLMIIYTPSFVIVVLSWITFWLSADAAAPRVTLGLTSLLTLTTQFATAQKDLPPVSYVKALDVWMLTCVVMVFGSLFEFALAYNTQIQRSAFKPVLKCKEMKLPSPTFSAKKMKLRAVGKKSLLVREPSIKGKKVNSFDAVARVFFPCVFIMFNCVYWPYYVRKGG